MDCGVKIFRNKVLEYLPSKPEFSLEKEVLPRLAERGLIGAYRVEAYALEIGTPAQLKETEAKLS